MHNLAAADGADDFQFIARIERGLGEPAARHDLAVAFYGQALAFEAERGNQLGHVERRHFELAGFAVNGQMNQGEDCRKISITTRYFT